MLGSVIEPSDVASTGRPRWRHGDYVLADVWELLAAVNAGSKSKPARYPRPGDDDMNATPERLAALAALKRPEVMDGG